MEWNCLKNFPPFLPPEHVSTDPTPTVKDAAKRKSDSCSVSSFVLTVDMLSLAESGCSDHEQNGDVHKHITGTCEQNEGECKQNRGECEQNGGEYEQSGRGCEQNERYCEQNRGESELKEGECEQNRKHPGEGRSGKMDGVGGALVISDDMIVGRGSDSAIGSEAMGEVGSSVGGGGDSAVCSGDEAMGGAAADEWGSVGGADEGGDDDAVGNGVLDLVGRGREHDSDDMVWENDLTGGRGSAGEKIDNFAGHVSEECMASPGDSEGDIPGGTTLEIERVANSACGSNSAEGGASDSALSETKAEVSFGDQTEASRGQGGGSEIENDTASWGTMQDTKGKLKCSDNCCPADQPDLLSGQQEAAHQGGEIGLLTVNASFPDTDGKVACMLGTFSWALIQVFHPSFPWTYLQTGNSKIRNNEITVNRARNGTEQCGNFSEIFFSSYKYIYKYAKVFALDSLFTKEGNVI